MRVRVACGRAPAYRQMTTCRPQVGSTTKTFEMSYVSNSNFETSELEKYELNTKKAYKGNKGLKTKSEIDKKVLELLDCKNWQYTNSEITQMVKEKVRARRANRRMTRPPRRSPRPCAPRRSVRTI